MHVVALSGGRVIDPESGLDAVADVAPDGARVAAVGSGLGAARRRIAVASAAETGDIVGHVRTGLDEGASGSASRPPTRRARA